MTTPTLEQQIAALISQVQWLNVQIANVYTRLQLPYATVTSAQFQRTETGMGPIIEPDKSSFV